MAKLRILVVDDNKDAADSLKIALEIQGHDVAVAYDGEQALPLLSTHLPHLAFLDIGMPGMSGHQLARLIRDGGRRIYLVSVSGWGQSDDIKASLAAGFDEHITKPATITQVFEITERLSRQHAMSS